jgi:predicted dienelactone hydrolase
MSPKPWKFILFIALFLLVFAISIYSQLELPAPSGTYSVGRTTLRWVDSSRPEVLTENPNDFREVVALVWYPAEPGTGIKAGYFPNLDSVADALVESGEVGWWQVFGLRFIRSESLLDSAVVKAANPFPVLMFSPGNGTNVEFYTSLASEIASHGYIVIGLNHPYDVPAVELSNGQIAPYDKDQWLLNAEAHQAYITERIKVRTADLLFVLDQLEGMNFNSLSAGLIDLGSVAVAGHSLGGIAASEACKADARFKACVNLDGLQRGGPFSMDERATPPEQPFLFLTKESQLHPKILERFESMPESYWIVIYGASHQSFTDGPLLQPSVLPGPNQEDQFMVLIRKYTLAFLDQTLKGRTRSLLSETTSADRVVKVFPSH